MLNKVLQRIAAALLCALVVVYIIIQISTALTQEIVTEHAGQSTIEEKIEVTGYILRNESVLQASKNGVVHSTLSEGAKLAKGETIATVYASDTAPQVQDEIARINQSLSVLEASVIDTNYATSTVAKQDQTIYSLLYANRENAQNGKYNLAVANHNDLLVAMNKRQLIVGQVTDFSTRIEQLNARKQSLTAGLTDALETIKAEESGYFSSQVDGYESLFTRAELDELTVNRFDELLEQKPEEPSSKTVGKVIKEFSWYLLCPIDRSQAAGFAEGQSYYLSFPYSSDVRLSANLDKKVMQTDRNTVILVFCANEIPRDFNFTRSQTVQIIQKSYSGLRIVKSALRQLDGIEGVYVLQGGTVTFKKVRRIHENEGYYLVEILPVTDPQSYQHLQLYDAVIIRGKDLYVGKVLS